ncbi:MAG: hypothetical protein ACP5PX_00590 [Candidatus Hadarchaeum sp.]|uniref:hypothetical protein n=1 Tax=Candidatus Hadarchaeum sp. TaxID=2883567 RepID=UPI003D0B3181
MVVTNLHCENCGYEWRPRGSPLRCPSCHSRLGETKARRWKLAGRRLTQLLASRGWRPGGPEGRPIDVLVEREGKRLFLDVKSGENYLIRGTQLEELLRHRGGNAEVGLALERGGKFYLFKLVEVLG